MTENFNLTSGKNRALVCYCANAKETIYERSIGFNEVIDSVFNDAGILSDSASKAVLYEFETPKTALNIALKWNEMARRLRVGGSFSDVCVGVFFYDQPAPPPQPEPDPDDEPDDAEKWREYISAYQSINQDVEPEPAPSITSLVCDALRDSFGGVYGASAFVVPSDVTEFMLEVE